MNIKLTLLWVALASVSAGATWSIESYAGDKAVPTSEHDHAAEEDHGHDDHGRSHDEVVEKQTSHDEHGHDEKDSGHDEGGDGHGGEDEHGHGDEEGHGEADSTKIDDHSADTMNIEVLMAGPATVHQTVSLTGKIILNQDSTAPIRARFPGIIKSTKKSVGDLVKKGDILATIESNESLQTYSVTSPLNGAIIARNASVGGLAGEEPIYVVADLNQLWAEFFVFSRDMDRIQTGQKVDVVSLSDSTNTEATITSLLPTTEASSQTVVARVTIDNADSKWRAGMTVRGDVVLNEKEVPLAVKTSAIQRQEGDNVVYVKKGETYEMRKVEMGQADREWTEILTGLKAGEEYVANNSFVVKADIGKAGAEHVH